MLPSTSLLAFKRVCHTGIRFLSTEPPKTLKDIFDKKPTFIQRMLTLRRKDKFARLMMYVKWSTPVIAAISSMICAMLGRNKKSLEYFGADAPLTNYEFYRRRRAGTLDRSSLEMEEDFRKKMEVSR